MLVCFIGINGSGKTAYATRLYRELRSVGLPCTYLHLDSIFAHIIFKASRRMSNLGKNEKTPFPKVSSKKSGSRFLFLTAIREIILFLIMLIDNLLFYWFKLRGRKGIIICDRYFYDSMISSICQGVNETFAYSIYLRIFPTPETIFLLDISPQLAYKRKQEGFLRPLVRSSQAYARFSAKAGNKVKINIVDASGDFEQSFNGIKSKVSDLVGNEK